jgi:hypothetical protein
MIHRGCLLAVWALHGDLYRKVIALTPRLDFRVPTAAAVVLKQEKPFHLARWSVNNSNSIFEY